MSIKTCRFIPFQAWLFSDGQLANLERRAANRREGGASHAAPRKWLT